jgi:hypothetical protein
MIQLRYIKLFCMTGRLESCYSCEALVALWPYLAHEVTFKPRKPNQTDKQVLQQYGPYLGKD